MNRSRCFSVIAPVALLILASLACGSASSATRPQAPVASMNVEAYDSQPLYLNVAVDDLGAEAYFNNGADTRQLWVKMNDKVAFVVAFGDVADEAGERALAELVAAAIK